MRHFEAAFRRSAFRGRQKMAQAGVAPLLIDQQRCPDSLSDHSRSPSSARLAGLCSVLFPFAPPMGSGPIRRTARPSSQPHPWPACELSGRFSIRAARHSASRRNPRQRLSLASIFEADARPGSAQRLAPRPGWPRLHGLTRAPSYTRTFPEVARRRNNSDQGTYLIQRRCPGEGAVTRCQHQMRLCFVLGFLWGL
jgi:hypothetical protein